MTKQRRRRIPGDVEDAIVARARQGWSPAQIAEALDQDPTLRDRRPSERTIRRIVAAERPPESQPWRLAEAPVEEAALGLDLLRAVVLGTENRVLEVTVAEVALVRRIHAARPNLPLFDAWDVARGHLADTAYGRREVELFDLYLAFATPEDDPDEDDPGSAPVLGLVQDEGSDR